MHPSGLASTWTSIGKILHNFRLRLGRLHQMPLLLILACYKMNKTVLVTFANVFKVNLLTSLERFLSRIMLAPLENVLAPSRPSSRKILATSLSTNDVTVSNRTS